MAQKAQFCFIQRSSSSWSSFLSGRARVEFYKKLDSPSRAHYSQTSRIWYSPASCYFLKNSHTALVNNAIQPRHLTHFQPTAPLSASARSPTRWTRRRRPSQGTPSTTRRGRAEWTPTKQHYLIWSSEQSQKGKTKLVKLIRTMSFALLRLGWRAMEVCHCCAMRAKQTDSFFWHTR